MSKTIPGVNSDGELLFVIDVGHVFGLHDVWADLGNIPGRSAEERKYEKGMWHFSAFITPMHQDTVNDIMKSGNDNLDVSVVG